MPKPTKDMTAAYDEHRKKMAKQSAEKSAMGRDIGEIPPVYDPERRAACERTLKLYCETYHPEDFPLEWSEDHLRVLSQMETAALEGGTFALAMPRGSGKTTMASVCCEWSLVYGHHSYIMFIGADATAGQQLLEGLKIGLETNEHVILDFPEICYPIQKLEGIAHRAGGQTCLGERTHIGWTAEKIILPTVKGSKASGGIVHVAGITGRIRGARFVRPDGKTVRPSLVICDDPQTDESAKSSAQVEARERILAGAILGLAGPGKKISAVMPCTVICPNDMADRMLNRELHPEWNGERTKLVYAWPTSELWQQYEDIYRQSLKDHGDLRDATSFYVAHREEMDVGAHAAWPARFNHDEASAIQHAYNLRLRDPRSFASEYQNEPLPDEAADDLPLMLTRAGLVSRAMASGYEVAYSTREEDGDSVHVTDITHAVEFATLGVDVQRGGERAPGRLYFVLQFFDKDWRSYVGAWGTIKLCPMGRQPNTAELHHGLSRLDLFLKGEEWPAAIVMRGVDVGDRAKELAPWITANRGWYAVRGQDSRMQYDPAQGDVRGVIHPRKQKDGWWLCHVERDNVREEIHTALSIPVGREGALHLPEGIQTNDSLVRHLVGTAMIMDNKRGLRWSESAKDRQHHAEWQRRIDLLDCSVYGRGLAHYWTAQNRKGRKKKYGVTKR